MPSAAPASMKIGYRRAGQRAREGRVTLVPEPAYTSLTSASPRHHQVLLLSTQIRLVCFRDAPPDLSRWEGHLGSRS